MAVQQVVRVTLVVGRGVWIYLMDFSLEEAVGGTNPREVLVGVGFLDFIIVLVFFLGLLFFSGFLFDGRGTDLFVLLLFPLFHCET